MKPSRSHRSPARRGIDHRPLPSHDTSDRGRQSPLLPRWPPSSLGSSQVLGGSSVPGRLVRLQARSRWVDRWRSPQPSRNFPSSRRATCSLGRLSPVSAPFLNSLPLQLSLLPLVLVIKPLPLRSSLLQLMPVIKQLMITSGGLESSPPSDPPRHAYSVKPPFWS